MGFWEKQWGFLENNYVFFKKQCFLTRLHTGFILIIKHMHFIKIKTIHVLHKLSFQEMQSAESQQQEL